MVRSGVTEKDDPMIRMLNGTGRRRTGAVMAALLAGTILGGGFAYAETGAC